MIKFYRKVDLNDRTEMIKFLKNHFRYDTMNSWNRLTSYANNMKIDRLGLDSNTVSALYDLKCAEDSYDTINEIINDFAESHDYRFQAYFNGRSGGYLVLYTGSLKDSEYKSYCIECGQKNYQIATDDKCTCGRCGAKRINYTSPPKIVITDSHSDFLDIDDLDDLEDSELIDRCKIVMDFDELCDKIVQAAVDLTKNYKAVEKTIMVPKKIVVMEPV